MAPRPVGSPYGTILSPCRQSAGAVRTGSLRTGKLCPRTGGGSRNGTVLTASDTDVTLPSGQFYIVQDNVTISDDLTVDGSQAGGLILCANATLTVNGALIHTGGTKFSIYGQTQPNTAARWSGSF